MDILPLLDTRRIYHYCLKEVAADRHSFFSNHNYPEENPEMGRVT